MKGSTLHRTGIVLGLLCWGVTQALSCEKPPDATPRQANPCAESHYCIKYGACHVAAEGDGSGDGGEESSRRRYRKPWLNPETNPHGRAHREPGNREPRRFELEDRTRCVIEKDADCRRALWSCRLDRKSGGLFRI